MLALRDYNIAQVLGVCKNDEPLAIVLEYTNHGDVNQFLKLQKIENTSSIRLETNSSRSGLILSKYNCLAATLYQ